MLSMVRKFRLIIIALLEGQGDEWPDQSFYMTGTFEDALEQGRKLVMDASSN